MIYGSNSNIHESPLAQKAYDFVFSLGEACLGASNLKASLLREYSCPFDWVYCASFEQRIAILLNDFNGYLEKDKLELRQNIQNIPPKWFINKENGIQFHHDFPPENFNWDNYYFFVKEKYDRRINRLLKILNTNKLDVLCVYIQLRITKISNDEIISLHNKLKQKFRANIDMLFIRYEPSFRMDELALENLSENIYIAKLNNKSINEWNGNDRMLSLLLDNINTKKLLQIKQSSATNTLFIYGCGVIGRSIAKKLARRNIGIYGFIVSDGLNIGYHNDIGKVYQLKELPIPYSEATVVFGLNRENMNAVNEYLQKYGIKFGFEYKFLS
jgi:phage regulator Rha-like protein